MGVAPLCKYGSNTATAVSVHDDVCEKAEQVSCGRLKYAVAVGSLGIIFSFISIVSTMMGCMNRILEIGTSTLCSVFFFFGVGMFYFILYLYSTYTFLQ